MCHIIILFAFTCGGDGVVVDDGESNVLCWFDVVEWLFGFGGIGTKANLMGGQLSTSN